jgi:hypothetical protein
MTSIDRPLTLPIKNCRRHQGTRINFPCEVRTPQKTRTVLVGWSDGLLPKYPACRRSASYSQSTAAKLCGYLPQRDSARTISSHESGYVLICRHCDWNLVTDLWCRSPLPTAFIGSYPESKRTIHSRLLVIETEYLPVSPVCDAAQHRARTPTATNGCMKNRSTHFVPASRSPKGAN